MPVEHAGKYSLVNLLLLNIPKFKGNCGSVTHMGVLKPLSAVLNPKLGELSLGLSYSLIHDDLFTFCNHFQHLRMLDVMYYAVSLPYMVNDVVHLTLSASAKDGSAHTGALTVAAVVFFELYARRWSRGCRGRQMSS